MSCLHQTSPRMPAFHGGWRGAAERRWHPVELAAMIVGFVLFWPIGLAILAWKKWMGDAPRRRDRHQVLLGPSDTGNVAFEDYKRQELERLEAERRRLFEAQDEFAAYLDRLKRSRDRAEFDQFMSERAASPRPAA
ncbi:MAG: DUF2852 domain-containing protein [Phreatobacter sp.]|jgi:hypothetical protein|uniref:DUF2852 domain-containing protein n=1 Tax=Phreatobacter sp. TaxID=1966341 RepID=UPI00403503BC